MRRFHRSLLLLAALVCVPARAQKPADLPKPTDYVSDFAGVLSPGTVQQLNLLAGEVEQKTNAQIAVVSVKSLEGGEIDDYAVSLYKLWGIGGRKDDRGVLILIAPNERRYRFEVGYGLEPILNDARVGDFGREMVPFLRQNDYNGATTQATMRVAQVIASDAGVQLTGMPEQRRRANDEGRVSAFWIFLFILFLIFVFGGRGRRRGRGGWVGPFIFPGGFGGGGGGWSGGGGFGSGSGFGGFGGGMSGGGGASGSW